MQFCHIRIDFTIRLLTLQVTESIFITYRLKLSNRLQHHNSYNIEVFNFINKNFGCYVRLYLEKSLTFPLSLIQLLKILNCTFQKSCSDFFCKRKTKKHCECGQIIFTSITGPTNVKHSKYVEKKNSVNL